MGSTLSSYEIIKSIQRGNKVIGVHLNGIKGKDSQIKSNGANAYDNLCLAKSVDETKKRQRSGLIGSGFGTPDLDSLIVNLQPDEKQGEDSSSHWLPAYDRVPAPVTQNPVRRFR